MNCGTQVKHESTVLCYYKKVNMLERHDKYQIFKRLESRERITCPVG